jgi:general secretion pathway protein D
MMGGYGSGMMGGRYGSSMMGGGNTSQELISLIMELIEPTTWYEMDEEAEGTMYAYPQASPKKLAVTNTPEVHAKIETFLKSMRQGLGEQVSIELRFLSVTENWLNDVGLDLDFIFNAGGKWGQIEVDQGSYVSASPEATGIPGSLGTIGASMGIGGGYGSILDDLQVAFLIRATQARTDIKTLNAPRVTVLNGEMAYFSTQEELYYMLPPSRRTTVTPTGINAAATSSDVTVDVVSVPTPPSAPLYVTPIISSDKNYVLLNINFNITELLRIHDFAVDYIGEEGTISEFRASVPEMSYTTVSTRVNVPDGGTILLGGMKVSKEIEKEAGVPILSKLPIINRLFSNRTYIKDQQIILVLVKPNIILQEESETDALGEMESLY